MSGTPYWPQQLSIGPRGAAVTVGFGRRGHFCRSYEVEKAEGAEKTDNRNGQEGEHDYALSDECSNRRSIELKSG